MDSSWQINPNFSFDTCLDDINNVVNREINVKGLMLRLFTLESILSDVLCLESSMTSTCLYHPPFEQSLHISHATHPSKTLLSAYSRMQVW